jgi:predicted RNase H-like HicB family nuclease
MKFIYPAIIGKKEDGSFEATFPDLDCCMAQGSSLEETVDAANAAMYDWIYLELSEDGTLPPISDLQDLSHHLKDGEVVRNICVNVVLTDGYDE